MGTYFSKAKRKIGMLLNTLKTRFSEPRFSEIIDLMNKLQLPFSYFTLYPDSI